MAHLILALVQGVILGLVLTHVFSGNEGQTTLQQVQDDDADRPLYARRILEPEVIDAYSTSSDSDRPAAEPLVEREFYDLWRNAIAARRSREEAWRKDLHVLRAAESSGKLC